MHTLAACTLCELQINKVCSPHDNLYRVVTQWQSHTHTHTHRVVSVVGSTASKHSSADKDILIEAQSTFATLEGKGQWHSSWNLLNDFFRSRTVRTRRDQLISWLRGWSQRAPLTSVFSTVLLLGALTSYRFSPQWKVQKHRTCLTHGTSPPRPSRTAFISPHLSFGEGIVAGFSSAEVKYCAVVLTAPSYSGNKQTYLSHHISGVCCCQIPPI